MDVIQVFKNSAHETKESELILNFGVDFCVCLSEPKIDIVPEEEWVPDSYQSVCTFCDTQFTFFTRRHHCRRCGRIICHNCSVNDFYSTKGHYIKRMCTLCSDVCRKTKTLSTFAAYQSFLSGPDPIIRVEIITGLRGALQTENSRRILTQECRSLLVQLVALLSPSNLPVVDEKVSNVLGVDSSSALLGQLLPLFINYTATLQADNLDAAVEIGLIDSLLPLFRDPRMRNVEMLHQQYIIWIFRNISRIEKGANALVEAKIVDRLIAHLDILQVQTFEEQIVCILANLTFYNTSFKKFLLKNGDLRLLERMTNLSKKPLSPMVKLNLARLIGNLAMEENGDVNKRLLYENNFPQTLLGLLETEGNFVCCAILAAMKRFLKLEDFATFFLNANIQSTLVNFLEDPCTLKALYATKFIESFLKEYPSCSPQFFQNSSIEDLKELFTNLLTSQHPKIPSLASKILRIFSSNDEKGKQVRAKLPE
eukprot:TRINITY_DN2594_c0_g3_i1.p1 TRINITY_DN2594_c0_g3~~TRINITY_DN2594_c0_g3_i1.p1  ORF type:complete len:495 (+),score=124.41 TRINITY_DN2594_c0_g3_i1:41-1486(+)